VALANRFLVGLGQPPANSAIVTVDVPGRGAAGPGRCPGRGAGRRVRASFHVYTTDEDVDLALDALTG
jgi:selenocysteine lyase/cysteine desulfurase